VSEQLNYKLNAAQVSEHGTKVTIT